MKQADEEKPRKDDYARGEDENKNGKLTELVSPP